MRSDELEESRAALVGAGLAEDGVLKSTGVAGHIERAAQGLVSRDILIQYAADLRALASASATHDTAIPPDFWDVRNPAMEAEWWDEYTFAHRLAKPEYREYLALLGRCYRHLWTFKEDGKGTAVGAALAILREATGYVHDGNRLDMTKSRPGLTPRQQAIFLWQQIVTGTNRQIPYIRRDAYRHGVWARFNVAEMWRYHAGTKEGVDNVWGVTGFAPRFVGDATNTNQIEHLTISALAQTALGLPALLLDVLEELEWILRRSTRAASQADKLVNRAVARDFLPLFRLKDPADAIVSLEKALKE